MGVFVWLNFPVIQSLHVGSLGNIPYITLRLLLSKDVPILALHLLELLVMVLGYQGQSAHSPN